MPVMFLVNYSRATTSLGLTSGHGISQLTIDKIKQYQTISLQLSNIPSMSPYLFLLILPVVFGGILEEENHENQYC